MGKTRSPVLVYPMICKRLKPFAFAAMISSCAAIPTTALAYCIDHAILLCMAGGFPPGAVCSSAKAVMNRRITPFPIEPPLQLWRCPIDVSAPAPYKQQSTPQPIKASFLSQPKQTTAARLWLAQAAGDDYLGFTREIRIINGSGFIHPANDRNPLRWRTSLQVCDSNSQNCSQSIVGTGYGEGENGMDNLPTPPGPSITYHSDHFNKDVRIERTLGRGLKLLYWDFAGNPTVTEWIYY